MQSRVAQATPLRGGDADRPAGGRPAQLAGAARSRSARLSAQELSTLIETLTARNRELRSGLADIREQLRQYERLRAAGPERPPGQPRGPAPHHRLRRPGGGRWAGDRDGRRRRPRRDRAERPASTSCATPAPRRSRSTACASRPARWRPRAPRSLRDRRRRGRAAASRSARSASPDGLLGAMQRPGGIISQLKLFIQAHHPDSARPRSRASCRRARS